jgi:hypothetical protein
MEVEVRDTLALSPFQSEHVSIVASIVGVQLLVVGFNTDLSLPLISSETKPI